MNTCRNGVVHRRRVARLATLTLEMEGIRDEIKIVKLKYMNPLYNKLDKLRREIYQIPRTHVAQERIQRMNAKTVERASEHWVPWCALDDDFICKNYGSMTRMEMAVRLRRSYRAVATRVYRLRKRGQLMRMQ